MVLMVRRSFRKDLSPKQVSKHWRKHKGLIPATGMVSHCPHPPSGKWRCSLCTTSLTPIPFCNGREYHIKQTIQLVFSTYTALTILSDSRTWKQTDKRINSENTQWPKNTNIFLYLCCYLFYQLQCIAHVCWVSRTSYLHIAYLLAYIHRHRPTKCSYTNV